MTTIEKRHFQTKGAPSPTSSISTIKNTPEIVALYNAFGHYMLNLSATPIRAFTDTTFVCLHDGNYPITAPSIYQFKTIPGFRYTEAKKHQEYNRIYHMSS